MEGAARVAGGVEQHQQERSKFAARRRGVASRRRLLASSLAGGLAVLTASPVRGERPNGERQGFTRFVHLTDIHLWGRRGAIEGFEAAMASIAALDPVPEFLITGGDHIMDGFGVDKHAARLLWDLYSDKLSSHCKTKVYPVIGNHDVWGWGLPSVAASEAGYGKAMALDRLGIPRPYYSFDRAGWHFICLDNIAPHEHIYTAAIDAAQLEWLAADLAAAGHDVPICVVSHIPLLSACVFFDGETISGDSFRVPYSCMQRDAGAILDVLRPPARPYNVRLALSGHIHLLDRVDYREISFLCNGAICGNWWQGPLKGTDEGYAVIDIWPDGRFRREYVAYARDSMMAGAGG